MNYCSGKAVHWVLHWVLDDFFKECLFQAKVGLYFVHWVPAGTGPPPRHEFTQKTVDYAKTDVKTMWIYITAHCKVKKALSFGIKLERTSQHEKSKSTGIPR